MIIQGDRLYRKPECGIKPLLQCYSLDKKVKGYYSLFIPDNIDELVHMLDKIFLGRSMPDICKHNGICKDLLEMYDHQGGTSIVKIFDEVSDKDMEALLTFFNTKNFIIEVAMDVMHTENDKKDKEKLTNLLSSDIVSRLSIAYYLICKENSNFSYSAAMLYSHLLTQCFIPTSEQIDSVNISESMASDFLRLLEVRAAKNSVLMCDNGVYKTPRPMIDIVPYDAKIYNKSRNAVSMCSQYETVGVTSYKMEHLFYYVLRNEPHLRLVKHRIAENLDLVNVHAALHYDTKLYFNQFTERSTMHAKIDGFPQTVGLIRLGDKNSSLFIPYFSGYDSYSMDVLLIPASKKALSLIRLAYNLPRHSLSVPPESMRYISDVLSPSFIMEFLYWVDEYSDGIAPLVYAGKCSLEAYLTKQANDDLVDEESAGSFYKFYLT